VQFTDVTFAYPNRGGLAQQRNIFEDLSFDLDMESRIALVGANGQGKTTLLKLITGEMAAKGGNIIINRRLRFATFSQHHVDQVRSLPACTLHHRSITECVRRCVCVSCFVCVVCVVCVA
jgi:ATPase subunit of ABC transporter with duplicated ATPase domains